MNFEYDPTTKKIRFENVTDANLAVELLNLLESKKDSQSKVKPAVKKERPLKAIERQGGNREIINDECVLLKQEEDYKHLFDSDLIYESESTFKCDSKEGSKRVIQRKLIIEFFIKRLNQPAECKQIYSFIASTDYKFTQGAIDTQRNNMRKLGILSEKDGNYFLSSKFINQ